jgi:uncharacterized membrane protein
MAISQKLPEFESPFMEPYADRDKARWLAAAFVLYTLIGTTFLAINVPPFQVSDEPAHFLRAAQLADGNLIGIRFATTGQNGSSHITSGGLADPALIQAAEPFLKLTFHPELKAANADWAPNIRWSGTRIMWDFANTVNNPPFFYLPSVIGILAGRKANLTVVQTLVVSRLLTSVTAIAVGAIAIAMAGGAAAWIFTILTLPMSLSQIASASHDALQFAFSALAGALLVRALRWPSVQDGKLLTGLALTLGLLVIARPPYGGLALLPLGLIGVRLLWRILAAVAVTACAAIWSAIAAAKTLTNFGDIAGADPSAQIALLAKNPLLAVTVIWTTLKVTWHGYFISFIGVLGWLDTPLPNAYYLAAAMMLGIAALASMLGMTGKRISCASLLAVAAGLVLSAAALFAIQYVTYTAPGHDVVNGVQGRYFIPLALAGTALLPALGDKRAARLHNLLLVLVVAFPVVSLAIVMRTVVLRYYLG